MQIKVDTHTHTYASGHAYSTLLENVASAKKHGLDILCSTDHASSMPGAPHYWFFNNQRVVPRLIDGITIFRGMEANIMPGGAVDIHPSTDQHLDWVLASFHEAVYKPADKKTHTQDLIRVIESGRIDALGHLGNPNYDFEFEPVIKAAKANHVAIELNNSSLKGGSRAGSEVRCEEIARLAKSIGAFVTTGSDAHFSLDVGGFEKVQELLQRVEMPSEQVITHSAQQFVDFLALRGRDTKTDFAHLV
ncbi:MAG: phosphatase [Vibrio sp.]